MARGTSGSGRGWFGDTAGHARAGKLGGQARGRGRRKNSSSSR